MNFEKKQEFEVIIDFDEASEAWRQNKKKQPNGCYKYVCMGITKKGDPCKRLALNVEDFCKMHMPKK